MQRALEMGERPPVLTGRNLGQVRFPLGGIGTGTVSLGGRGQLTDWEVFNRPAKGLDLPLTFFALWTRAEGDDPVTRVLERQLLPPFTAAAGLTRPAGLPRLAECEFRGEYPFAWLSFKDPALPVQVALEAYNPMVPLDADASGLPVAIFNWTLVNPGPSQVEVSLAFNLFNACGSDGRVGLMDRAGEQLGGNLNEPVDDGDARGLLLSTTRLPRDHPQFGTMAVATSWAETAMTPRWRRAPLWLPDALQAFWDDFSADGALEVLPGSEPSPEGVSDIGTVALRASLAPGEQVTLPLVLAWHFPNLTNAATWGWGPDHQAEPLGNAYAVGHDNAWSVAAGACRHAGELRSRTLAFHDALFDSTLPAAALDAVSSQMSIIRTTTCLRTSDGAFHGFEGCNDDSGCCPLNCTHVWNYEQALAHLYPALERTMRSTDFRVNTRDSGAMAFRTILPLIPGQGWDWLPAADGQMGCILKLYREWQLDGDLGFVRDLWPQVKRSLEFAWELWDRDKDGVMEGQQHNTYDIEFYGPNTMMGTLYLGALRAAAAMAEALGEADTAASYRDLADRGSQKLDADLWNGEFYIQRVLRDVPRDEQHASMSGDSADFGGDGEPPHQYGPGCLSDQLLGEWFAQVVGLQGLLAHGHVVEALRAIHRHNWRVSLSTHASAQRTYALNDEAGLLLCSWPNGGRPARPFPYSDEVWTGIEYQVAAHMIYEGMVDEGLGIVTAVRARHDGERRNPWDEFECGHHYARAMASWSVLLALSGFSYSAPEARLGFAPRVNAGDFRCFFSTGHAWGVFSQQRTDEGLAALVSVVEGSLELATLTLRRHDGDERDESIELPVHEVVSGGGSIQFELPA